MQPDDMDAPIRLNNELYSTMFLQVPLGIALIDSLNGKFLDANPRFAEIAGRSIEEMRNIDWMSITHPDDVQEDLDNMALMNAGKTSGFTMDKRYIRPDGSIVWIRMTIASLRVEKNVSPQHFCMVDDITAHRGLGEELQLRVQESEKARQAMLFMLEDMNESSKGIEQAKKQWEATFDAVSDPIFLHDAELRIVRANRAYAEKAGMSVEDVIGQRYWDVFPKGEGPMPGCAKALEKAEEEEEEEEEVKTDDGRTYLSHTYAIKDEGGMHNLAIHFMQDITERRQSEINLEHASRALTALSTVNRELVHAVSEAGLLQAICQAVVEQHGYRMAWVGYVQEDKKRSIKIMANAGGSKDLLDKIRPSWAENDSAFGPSGRAVLSGKVQLTKDIAGDSEYPPWQDLLLKHGCASGLALPLRDANKQVFGLLSVYAEKPDAFTDREISLLEETADDLAFGVRSLRVRLQRDEALEVNQQQLELIRQNLRETIGAVAKAVEARDPYTAGHQRRVAILAAGIAQGMGMEQERIEGLRMGATIHDIGKIHLPAEILSKPAKLSDIEYSLIKAHPQVGYDILKDISFPWPIAEIACQHHERMDGSGYPQGLKGDEICLEARIVAVADVVEAMSSHRPYRAGLGIDMALGEIKRGRGSHYDADVVDACLKLFADGFTWPSA